MIEEKDKALRFNKGKTKWSLVHFGSLKPMIDVLTFGAEKYTVLDEEGKVIRTGKNQWKAGLDREELLESMQRHLSAMFDGEEHDQESKISHIGHIMCNCMFYSFLYIINKPTNK